MNTIHFRGRIETLNYFDILPEPFIFLTFFKVFAGVVQSYCDRNAILLWHFFVHCVIPSFSFVFPTLFKVSQHAFTQFLHPFTQFLHAFTQFLHVPTPFSVRIVGGLYFPLFPQRFQCFQHAFTQFVHPLTQFFFTSVYTVFTCVYSIFRAYRRRTQRRIS